MGSAESIDHQPRVDPDPSDYQSQPQPQSHSHSQPQSHHHHNPSTSSSVSSSSPSPLTSNRRTSHFRIRQRLASWHHSSDSKQSKNTTDQQSSTSATEAKDDNTIMHTKSATSNGTNSHFNQKLKNFFRINSSSNEKDNHKDHKEKGLDNFKSDSKSGFRQSRKFFGSVGRLRSTTTASEGNPLDESLSPTAHANPYFAHQGLPNLRHHNEGSVPPSPPDTPSLKIHHVDGAGKEEATSATKEELARKLRRVASAPNAQGLFNKTNNKGSDERPATAELGKEPLIPDPSGLGFVENKTAMSDSTLAIPDRDGLGALPSSVRNPLNFRRTYSSNSIKVRNVEVSPASFDKIKLIGKGDVGKVYLVREKKSSRLYAMKGKNNASFLPPLRNTDRNSPEQERDD